MEKIKDYVLSILGECSIKENLLYLPSIQLDRKTYVDINKILEMMGGKWDKKVKAHVFTECPEDLLETVLLTGEITNIKKEFQFFETPKNLAMQMIEWAEIRDNDIILEPSAGRGAIAGLIPNPKRLYVYELNKTHVNYLKLQNYPNIIEGDFLSAPFVVVFDKIIMNPPFHNGQDISHIQHAYNFLKSGGILVSVVSESPFFRTNKKYVDFIKFLSDTKAKIIKNTNGAFKESGTMVNTRLIKIVKT